MNAVNHPSEVTYAVLAERIDNLKEDIAELKESMRYQSRALIGMAISLLLVGVAGILAMILAAPV